MSMSSDVVVNEGKGLGSGAKQRWRCVICGFVFDEALGLPQEGIAPGTAWADVPESWTCPDCGVRKVDFSMAAIGEHDR